MRKIYRQISPAWIAIILFFAIAAAVTVFSISAAANPPEDPDSGIVIIEPSDPPLAPPQDGAWPAMLIGAGVSLALIPLAAFVDKMTGRAS